MMNHIDFNCAAQLYDFMNANAFFEIASMLHRSKKFVSSSGLTMPQLNTPRFILTTERIWLETYAIERVWCFVCC